VPAIDRNYSTQRRISKEIEMSYLKKLCVALPAALVALAAVAAIPASATTLCKANEAPCSEANEWEQEEGGKDIPVTYKASLKAGTEAEFASSITAKCKKSSITGLAIDTEQEPDEVPLEITVTALSFSECSGCTVVTAQGLPWTGGTLEATGSGNGEFAIAKVKVLLEKCPLGASCTMTAGSIVMDFTGGKPAELKAVKEPVSVSGAFCGTSGVFTATYSVTEPNPVWAVKG
jgi:hypothetical protein